ICARKLARQSLLELLHPLLELVHPLLKAFRVLGSPEDPRVPAELLAEVAPEVAADLPAQLSEVDLPALALLDRDGHLAARAVAGALDLQDLAGFHPPRGAGEIARHLDRLPAGLRDDVADLDAGLLRRAVRFDGGDQHARVPRRAEMLPKLRRHLQEPDAEVTAPAVVRQADDHGVVAIGGEDAVLRNDNAALVLV